MSPGRSVEAHAKPGPRVLPVRFDRASGEPHVLRDLLDGETAEKAKLDDGRLACVEPREFFQRVIEREQIDRLKRTRTLDIARRHFEPAPISAPLDPGFVSCLVHQYRSERLRRQCREFARAAIPFGQVKAPQPHPCFMNQRGGLQQPGALAALENRTRDRTQLIMDAGFGLSV